MKTAIGIIPAHYDSKRFPGKVLTNIEGKPMIQHVYERAQEALDRVYIATDDVKIYETAKRFGAEVIQTHSHNNGTSRCIEALEIIRDQLQVFPSIVVNIQADMPWIDSKVIKRLLNSFALTAATIATLVTPIKDESLLNDDNCVKVVIDRNDFAMYFSRFPIPYIAKNKPLEYCDFFKHIGIYIFESYTLHHIQKMKPHPIINQDLSLAEDLEQLRWMEYGFRIKCITTETDVRSVDTPEDLK